MPGVEEKVTRIIVDQLGVATSEVTLEARFVEDLNADSLNRVELIMALEEAFGVEITDADTEQMRTVRDAVGYIEKHAKSVKQ